MRSVTLYILTTLIIRDKVQQENGWPCVDLVERDGVDLLYKAPVLENDELSKETKLCGRLERDGHEVHAEELRCYGVLSAVRLRDGVQDGRWAQRLGAVRHRQELYQCHAYCWYGSVSLPVGPEG